MARTDLEEELCFLGKPFLDAARVLDTRLQTLHVAVLAVGHQPLQLARMPALFLAFRRQQVRPVSAGPITCVSYPRTFSASPAVWFTSSVRTCFGAGLRRAGQAGRRCVCAAPPA